MGKYEIYLSPPHMSGEELLYVQQVFDSNWIAPIGPHVEMFEKELSKYVQVRNAVALSSGTAAIHLALRLLGIKENDVVFCSTLTFVASANPILYEKAIPIFIDSEPDTWNMSPKALEKALSDAKKNGKLPKAVIVVHLYGQSAKMDEILSLCEIYGVPVIEDAAEALGATYKGKKLGSIGYVGIYSFNGNKIITTSGGGALVSNDEELIEKARFLSQQARDAVPYYQHSQMGYNYRLSNVLAGIGIAQLQMIDVRVRERRRVFKRYVEALSHIDGISFMPELPESYGSRWLTTLTCHNKKITVEHCIKMLEERKIEARHVWKPLHLQPLFQGATYYKHGDDSVSEHLFQYGLCLPSGSSLTESEQERVIDVLIAAMNKR